MIGLEATPEQVQELLDGLQVVVLLAAIGLPVLVGLLLAVMFSLFRNR